MAHTTDQEHATDYRNRASELAAYAATLQDQTLRNGFLDVAASYRRMAEHLEKKPSLSRAAGLPAQPAEGRDIAAATPHPEEPKDN